MLAYFERILESRERRGLIRDQRALLRAKTLTESHRAAFSGCQVVPAGHALVRPAGMETVMDVVPTIQPSGMTPQSSPLTSADVGAQKVDIVKACLEPQQAVRVISGQRQGKSWAVMHVAAAWLSEGRDVYVIGPKRRPSEWLGCKRQIGPCPYIIGNALLSIQSLAYKRMEEGERQGIGGEQWPPIMVVLDDWLAAAALFRDKSLPEELQGLPERFITDACVIMASQNISVYMVAHADTAAAMNVDKVGAALKDDTLGIWVRKLSGGPREYGVTLPAEKGWTKDGVTHYPRYGFLPDGPPQWPGTDGEPEPGTAQNQGFSPGEDVPSDPVPAQEFPGALPAAPPRKVEIKTPRGWREIELTERDGTLARRAYEKRGKLSDVIGRMKFAGHKKVKLELAKAMLGLKSNDYRILGGAS